MYAMFIIYSISDIGKGEIFSLAFMLYNSKTSFSFTKTITGLGPYIQGVPQNMVILF